jgi:hypothetical protein
MPLETARMGGIERELQFYLTRNRRHDESDINFTMTGNEKRDERFEKLFVTARIAVSTRICCHKTVILRRPA